MAVDTERAATSGRARNRRGEGGRLRSDIVRAATELLDETGSAGAITLRAVARHAGITAPAIYPHFPDPPSILLAVVHEEFVRLRDHLGAAAERVEDDAVARLHAACAAYLEYARTRPERYLVLFGGVWNAGQAIRDSVVALDDVVALGQDVLGDLTLHLQRCVDEGSSSSTDVATDAVGLWVGMHGLAHQQTAAAAFPWPHDLERRLIERLAYL